jgi:hypothetical protein
MKNFYDILGVEPDASDEEMKRMYHKLSKKYHPDANLSDPDLRQWSEARMKELNEAYDTLSDPAKRARYSLEQGYSTGPMPSSPFTGWSAQSVQQWKVSFVWRSAAINAGIFALFGLMRGGLPAAAGGAALGAVIGAMIANIRISKLPAEVSTGALVGMFLGALVIKISLVGLLMGGLLGALAGWYYRQNSQ